MGDIHGDEEIEYNFLAGNEGIPAWDDRLKKLQDEFCKAFLHTSPDFQLGNGYGEASPLMIPINAANTGAFGAEAYRAGVSTPLTLDVIYAKASNAMCQLNQPSTLQQSFCSSKHSPA